MTTLIKAGWVLEEKRQGWGSSFIANDTCPLRCRMERPGSAGHPGCGEGMLHCINNGCLIIYAKCDQARPGPTQGYSEGAGFVGGFVGFGSAGDDL